MQVESSGGSIYAGDHVNLAVGIDVRFGGNLITSEVVVSDEGLTWLVNVEAVRKLASAETDGETVSSIVGAMNFTDLESIVSQIVVDNEGKVIALGEEAEHLTVVIQELLLRFNFAAAEALLHVVSHFRILLWLIRSLRDDEVVDRVSSRWSQRSSLTLQKENKEFEC